MKKRRNAATLSDVHKFNIAIYNFVFTANQSALICVPKEENSTMPVKYFPIEAELYIGLSESNLILSREAPQPDFEIEFLTYDLSNVSTFLGLSASPEVNGTCNAVLSGGGLGITDIMDTDPVNYKYLSYSISCGNSDEVRSYDWVGISKGPSQYQITYHGQTYDYASEVIAFRLFQSQG